jgi:SAM-dependent methyltransferase
MNEPIDWAARYRAHMARASRRDKTAADWDARAGGLSQSTFDSRYVHEFIARMDLAGCETLLDVGCGPGAIALALAPKLSQVVGLDFSPAMLEAFAAHASRLGITNARTIQRAWEDDWHDVPVCDIVVASRSSQVADLGHALEQLQRHARRRVYLTHLVGGRFFEPEVYAALDWPEEALPDYIYVVNILHQRGIHARVDFLDGGNRLGGCTDFEDCARRVAWSVGPLTDDERGRLRAAYDTGRLGRTPIRWALVSWIL